MSVGAVIFGSVIAVLALIALIHIVNAVKEVEIVRADVRIAELTGLDPRGDAKLAVEAVKKVRKAKP